eukprot:gb/GECH01000733.1/.p1 GENE.gb/GECH01000733.1/~~gb/GECH01000733.1/.p1  ORF type:complete len:118 (+),score=23.48 gb/GECH01000733.1/:1-354(+)
MVIGPSHQSTQPQLVREFTAQVIKPVLTPKQIKIGFECLMCSHAAQVVCRITHIAKENDHIISNPSSPVLVSFKPIANKPFCVEAEGNNYVPIKLSRICGILSKRVVLIGKVFRIDS